MNTVNSAKTPRRQDAKRQCTPLCRVNILYGVFHVLMLTILVAAIVFGVGYLHQAAVYFSGLNSAQHSPDTAFWSNLTYQLLIWVPALLFLLSLSITEFIFLRTMRNRKSCHIHYATTQ